MSEEQEGDPEPPCAGITATSRLWMVRCGEAWFSLPRELAHPRRSECYNYIIALERVLGRKTDNLYLACGVRNEDECFVMSDFGHEDPIMANVQCATSGTLQRVAPETADELDRLLRHVSDDGEKIVTEWRQGWPETVTRLFA